MTFKSLLSTGLLAALLAVSLGTQAAADIDKAAAGKSDAAVATTDRTTKPDSKAEGKSGAPQKTAAVAAEAKSGKLRADKDRSKHYHPRDGKS